MKSMRNCSKQGQRASVLQYFDRFARFWVAVRMGCEKRPTLRGSVELLGTYWIGSNLPKYSATLRLISTLCSSSRE